MAMTWMMLRAMMMYTVLKTYLLQMATLNKLKETKGNKCRCFKCFKCFCHVSFLSRTRHDKGDDR